MTIICAKRTSGSALHLLCSCCVERLIPPEILITAERKRFLPEVVRLGFPPSQPSSHRRIQRLLKEIPRSFMPVRRRACTSRCNVTVVLMMPVETRTKRILPGIHLLEPITYKTVGRPGTKFVPPPAV